MIDLSIEKNPLISFTKRQGCFKEEDIEVVSGGIDFAIDDFKFPKGISLNNIPRFIVNTIGPFIKIYPQVFKEECTGCGDCSKICPVEAISIKSKKSNIDYSKCIQRMCCFEVCRFKATKVKESFLLRLIRFFQGLKKFYEEVFNIQKKPPLLS